MASIVMKAAQASGGSGGAAQQVSSIADAAEHIMQVARTEAARAKEAGRIDNNEFNIRKNFLLNAVNAIQEATLSQYNIVVCTDQAHDDFQNLKGQVLPMDLLDVEVSQGKVVNFEVYVFDTGNYLRHGKYEQDSWWYWGESKKWYDPAAMHVDFNKAQIKLDPAQVQKQQAQNATQTQTATAANTATQAVQATTAAMQGPALATDAASVAAYDAQTLGVGAAAGTAAPAAPAAPAAGAYGYPSAVSSYGSSSYSSGGAPGAAANATPAPGLMDHLVSAASTPMMQMFMGGVAGSPYAARTGPAY